MPRLEQLSEIQRKTLLMHPCLLNDTAPWTPLAKPLARARLALVTTAGLHVRGDQPFTGGEQGYRTIPSDTPARDILLSHTSIGFDRSGIQRDLNLVLPVDRMRELVRAGELGSLGTNFYSFMGAQRTYDGILQESGPEVARKLREDDVDVVFLTGA
jgi:D-proline reductase (dithiol) PrdB